MPRKQTLVVNVLPETHPAAQAALEAIRQEFPDVEVFHAYEKSFRPCIGCNACWLITPGTCAIRDGYETLLRAYLRSNAVLFLSGTALGFVDHRMKNVVDRSLPLATMYTRISDGQFRHVPRYDRHFRFGLLYSGQADGAYLNRWMQRYLLNFGGENLGAFPIEQLREVLSCI